MTRIKKNAKTANFGMHLMLDAYGANEKSLDDMRVIFNFLDTLVKRLDMHSLTNPVVVDVQESASGKDSGGISGMIMIVESHISIHTFPKRRFFTLDLYSCNNFDEQVEDILAFIKETFGYEDTELNIVKRGLKFPMKNLVK
jgi:S-adenosylmethionine decarboxylase